MHYAFVEKEKLLTWHVAQVTLGISNSLLHHTAGFHAQAAALLCNICKIIMGKTVPRGSAFRDLGRVPC